MKIICPNMNCRYRGKGKPIGGANALLFLILFCLGILPGILYLMCCPKRGTICPKCGTRIN